MECGRLVESWGHQCKIHDPTGKTRKGKVEGMALLDGKPVYDYQGDGSSWVCSECGSVVLDFSMEKHDKWHVKIDNISERARSYVPPPLYK